MPRRRRRLTMMNTSRIYLDNAATSWPKPDAVYEAVELAMRELGAPAGRSGYEEATEVERRVRDTRVRIAALVNCSDSNGVVFTANGTDSLNLALHGLLRAGDHVVTTAVEHNSVLRPLTHVKSQDIRSTIVDCATDGTVDPDAIRTAIRSETRVVVVNHASNVLGTIQPLQEIGAICAEHDILFLVDAAQSLGHIPVNMQAAGIDALAAPGHKGLLGPLGTGILVLNSRAAELVVPLRQGGTGTTSEVESQPDELPAKMESGNLNVPGILGLRAGLEYVAQRGLEELRSHELMLQQRLWTGLDENPHIQRFGPVESERVVGVTSFTVSGYEPQEVAGLLDATYRIQVRAGLHCAPRIHRRLGTDNTGGTIRVSTGPFTTVENVDQLLRALQEFVSGI